MIKILIADDHPIVRKGLKEILSEHPDMKVLGEAQNSHEVLNLIRKEHWDVVVLDITMPGRDGLDVLKELKKTRPKLPVLVLSIHPEEQYGVRALKAGASGYLQKESAPAELVTAVRKIARGGKYVTPSLAERLAVELVGPGDREPHEVLSDREYQVLTLLASGKGIKEIALELSLSAPTIATYRSRVMTKLRLGSTVDLVRYALEHKLVE